MACAPLRSVTRFIPAPAGNTWRSIRPARRRTVHPRACGEHIDSTNRCGAAVGSSPRLRGTLVGLGAEQARPRFIPAPAGNTDRLMPSRSPDPVHPRACGEHTMRHLRCVASTGSSPRLRGTRGAPRAGESRLRFIPAPAGNTSYSGLGTSTSTVHPRACGEHMFSTCTASSCERFIPAPAGNTPNLRGRYRETPVHPRACGEHHFRRIWRRIVFGSSPRLRGTQKTLGLPLPLYRFIPAPAGNTRRRRDGGQPAPVHPRACGEHPSRGARWPRAAVHPRACGEHCTATPSSMRPVSGSSPRLRGTPLHLAVGAETDAVHPRACGEHASCKVLLDKHIRDANGRTD